MDEEVFEEIYTELHRRLLLACDRVGQKYGNHRAQRLWDRGLESILRAIRYRVREEWTRMGGTGS